MRATAEQVCPSCRRRRRGGEPGCPLCGRRFDPQALLPSRPRRVVSAERLAALDDTNGYQRVAAPRPPRRVRRPVAEVAESTLGSREAWIALGIGLATAPVLAWTPLLRFMGWFLASLVHEIGHAGTAWLFGQPAFPAISLAGHAAAIHQEQVPVLVLAIAAGLAALGWTRLRVPHARAITAGVVAVYLLAAFTPLKEPLFLVAGHTGELAFAGVFLWRCATGGFTHSPAERALYGTLGWFLVGKNAVLAVGLLGSETARVAYSMNGSFGLENDLLRLPVPLELAATGLLLGSLAAAAFALWVASRTRVDEER